MSPRMLLSPPETGDRERAFVLDALDSGWVAPLGPHVERFEAELAAAVDRRHAVALSSGTAGLHLGLLALGVGAGDEVVVPTFTFAATAFAVVHAGAQPVLVDSEAASWTLDPDLLDGTLADLERARRPAAAVVSVDLFGEVADYARLLATCEQYGVPLLADSAEALGATWAGRPAGSVGDAAVFSFNGNKIITTSGGGMLVTDDAALATRVRHRATQAREPAPWYEHAEVGFNFRLSNLLAALGRAQLAELSGKVARRRAVRERYEQRLGALPGVQVRGDGPYGRGNGWLSVVTFDPALHPDGPRAVREAAAAVGIEVRPVWKPMHQQPVFATAPTTLSGVADTAFATSVCLPSGSVSDADVDEVCDVVERTL